MTLTPQDLSGFLASVHPYDCLGEDTLARLTAEVSVISASAGTRLYGHGERLEGLYLIHHGEVDVRDENDTPLSILGPRNAFGERGLMADGLALTTARVSVDALLILVPEPVFARLLSDEPAFSRFFARQRSEAVPANDLATAQVNTLMARPPVTCPPDTTVRDAAHLMRTHRISSLCVTEGDALTGIVTSRDLTGRIIADALPFDTPVAQIMTERPITLGPSAIGSDVLHAMMEQRVGHIPICEGGKLTGIVTQTDLTRFQAVSSAELVRRLASASTAEDMAQVTADIPRLLVQLTAGGNRHDVVTRLITDVADTATRRLLALAEETLGPPPVPYLWLACGSQGRQEQTGASDQDNCLMLDDAVTEAQLPYFEELARLVCDGLNTCGYVHCPGDMMATNPRWRQPERVWRQYFASWIANPDPEAQMLASVMFDLRPIGGEAGMFDDFRGETLKSASRNSIFVAHMIANSLKHAPPLGLLRGFATIRTAEHRHSLDMKHNGVVPVVDLGRVYALQGHLAEVGTRARLQAAENAGVLSASGSHELRDAYDLIAESRLAHQAEQIRQGGAPDNYLLPASLSEFERNHLRNAFVVVKTMQSALGHGRGILS